jgi:hypothetical protein
VSMSLSEWPEPPYKVSQLSDSVAANLATLEMSPTAASKVACQYS